MRKIILLFVLMAIAVGMKAQNITRSYENVPLSKALKQMNSLQSEYEISFIYDELTDFTVTTDIYNASVPEAVRQMTELYPIHITEFDGYVLVECEKTAHRLIGYICDEDKHPVEFANVAVLSLKDSTMIVGGVSNESGRFVIPCNENEALIRVSCMGMKTIYKKVAIKDIGTIRMEQDQYALKNVNVEGRRVINKTDRTILIPTKNAIKTSDDGLVLLKKMSLTGITVDPVQQKISSMRGGGVQLRVNNIKVNEQELLAIRPDEVVRIEHIENPGVRYSEDNLDAVINIVTRRRYSGYVAGAQTMQSPTTGFNNSSAYYKYNYKKSEFSLAYVFSWRDYDKRHRDSKTTYIQPDGTVRERNEYGYNDSFEYLYHNFQLGYNLAEPDKYTLNSKFILNWLNRPSHGYTSRIEESGQKDLLNSSGASTTQTTPSLDIYYSVNLPKKQTLDVNVVGTYMGTSHQYAANEYLFDTSLEKTLTSNAQNHYGYDTDGKKYSLISEAIYNKQFAKTILSAGANYSVSRTDNKYVGSENVNTLLNSNNLYAFVQLQGRLGKLAYQAGVGANYSDIHQGDVGFSKWIFRPQLTLMASPIKNVSLRYTSRISPQIPALSQLSEVRQQTNGIDANDGNANLKPYTFYSNSLSIGWNTQRFSFNTSGSWSYMPDAIMESIIPEKQSNGSYIYSFKPENQKSFNSYDWQNYLVLHAIPDVLDINLAAYYTYQVSKGLDYRRTLSNWIYMASADLTLGKWNINYVYMSQPKGLWGATVSGGENQSSLNVTYKLGNLRLGVGCLLLGYAQGFDYTGDTQTSNYKSTSDTWIKNNGNMVYFSLSYTFAHGRKYQSGERKLNNSDSDNGIR